jgi:hypothetical protein
LKLRADSGRVGGLRSTEGELNRKRRNQQRGVADGPIAGRARRLADLGVHAAQRRIAANPRANKFSSVEKVRIFAVESSDPEFRVRTNSVALQISSDRGDRHGYSGELGYGGPPTRGGDWRIRRKRGVGARLISLTAKQPNPTRRKKGCFPD